MPNAPQIPGQHKALFPCFMVGFFGFLVIGHFFGFIFGAIVALGATLETYFLIVAHPHVRPALIKRDLKFGSILIVFYTVFFGYLVKEEVFRFTLSGFIISVIYFSAMCLSYLHIKAYLQSGSTDPATPLPTALAPGSTHQAPGSGPLPSGTAAAAGPGPDPFAFDASRFHAATPPPRPSRFVPLIEKFSIDLSSDEQAYKFAEGLKASARDHILRMLDDEINDPATSAELRRFLRQVRAHLAGDVPPDGSALDHERRRALPPQAG